MSLCVCKERVGDLSLYESPEYAMTALWFWPPLSLPDWGGKSLPGDVSRLRQTAGAVSAIMSWIWVSQAESGSFSMSLSCRERGKSLFRSVNSAKSEADGCWWDGKQPRSAFVMWVWKTVWIGIIRRVMGQTKWYPIMQCFHLSILQGDTMTTVWCSTETR